MKKEFGFTLIELIFTVAMVAILLTVGVPSFQEMLRSNRAVAQANMFMSTLNVARSEAVKRGVRVSLCSSSNQTNCTGGTNWASGWIVFVDTAATDTDDPVVGEVLRADSTLPGSPTFTGPQSIRYRPMGTVVAQSQFSYSLGSNNYLICVTSVGRPRIDKFNNTCP